MSVYKNIVFMVAVLCATVNLSMAAELSNPIKGANQKNRFSFKISYAGEEKTYSLPFESLNNFLERVAAPNVTYLDFSGLPLTELPNNLDRFTNLKGLDFRHCPLAQINLTDLSCWAKHRKRENPFLLVLGSDTPLQKIELPELVFFSIECAHNKRILIDANSIQSEADLSNFKSLLRPEIIGDRERNRVVIGFKGESDYLRSLINQEIIRDVRRKLFTDNLPSDDLLIKISSNENCLPKNADVRKFSREISLLRRILFERHEVVGEEKLLIINFLEGFLPKESVEEARLQANKSLENKLSDENFLEEILLGKYELNEYLKSLNEGQGLGQEQRIELARTFINQDVWQRGFFVKELLKKAVSTKDDKQKLTAYLDSIEVKIKELTNDILDSLKPVTLEEISIVNRFFDISTDFCTVDQRPLALNAVTSFHRAYSSELRIFFYGISCHEDPRNTSNIDCGEITQLLRESVDRLFDLAIKYSETNDSWGQKRRNTKSARKTCSQVQ